MICNEKIVAADCGECCRCCYGDGGVSDSGGVDGGGLPVDGNWELHTSSLFPSFSSRWQPMLLSWMPVLTWRTPGQLQHLSFYQVPNRTVLAKNDIAVDFDCNLLKSIFYSLAHCILHELQEVKSTYER